MAPNWCRKWGTDATCLLLACLLACLLVACCQTPIFMDFAQFSITVLYGFLYIFTIFSVIFGCDNDKDRAQRKRKRNKIEKALARFSVERALYQLSALRRVSDAVSAWTVMKVFAS